MELKLNGGYVLDGPAGPKSAEVKVLHISEDDITVEIDGVAGVVLTRVQLACMLAEMGKREIEGDGLIGEWGRG